ncbi:dynein axonemal assembly factor 19-like isoform X2 [Apostichopus japonicus]|uniref:dynein axonemal assembly factor 19-like isoform X2 n=1 Tax=Stichopus japonicus TaxID=307972 RepID=UPI003AB2B0E8
MCLCIAAAISGSRRQSMCQFRFFLFCGVSLLKLPLSGCVCGSHFVEIIKKSLILTETRDKENSRTRTLRMADLKEDKIDFRKLEKELENAMKADAKYWRENDAKMRAVEQRVESYEQFRDIVAASHLQPLEKKDKISESKLQQPWNTLATSDNKKQELRLTRDTEERLSAGNLPHNSLEFTRDWRRCQDRYKLLMTIGSTRLEKVMKSDIGMGVLGEILVSLNASFVPEDATAVADILECLPNCGRFSLALDFLSRQEKQSAKELVEKLEDSCESNEDEDVKSLREELQKLGAIYQLNSKDEC